jgi:hypothetical protein
VKRGLWLAFAALLLSGCGSDDDSPEPRPPAPGLTRFESPRIAFTFDYPKDFVAEKRPRENVLGRVAVERGSRLNAIKVRRTARRELNPKRYLGAFQRDFQRTVGVVDKDEQLIGDLETGVLVFEDSVSRSGKNVAFKSSSYFFKGGGQTWQVECISDAEHRTEIETACRAALESVDFGR